MKKFLLMCFSFGFALSVWAQDRVVTGKLTSKEDGSALPGVNVVLKGTTVGTVTDAEGNYKLSVPAAGGTIVFSFIGLETLEVAIGERSVVDAQLGSDVKQLSEVVVTGSGVATDKKKLGIAVESVTADKLPATPSSSIDQALIGKIAGAQISSISGNPGDPVNILLRGINTVQGGTKPLIMVDGVQVAATDINSLDLTNVDRVEVVQGAASASIYGAQGANGVIQIFTKRGKKGKVAVNFSSSYAENTFLNVGDVHKARLHPYLTDANNNIIDPSGNILQYIPEGSIEGISYEYGGGQNGGLGDQTAFQKPRGVAGATRYAIQDIRNVASHPYNANLKYYDHFKQIFQTGYTTNNNLNFSGAGDKTDFAVSIANNHTLSPVIKNGGIDRTNLTVNVGFELFKGFKIRSITQGIYTKNDLHPGLGAAGYYDYGRGNSLGDVGRVYGFLNTSPFFDLTRKDDDGNYPFYQTADFLSVNASNPYYNKQYSSSVDNKIDVLQNFEIDYNINKFFELNAKYGINYRTENAKWTYLNQSQNSNSVYYDPNYIGIFAGDNTGELINWQYQNTFQNFLANGYFRTDLKDDFGFSLPISLSTQVGFDYRKKEYREYDTYGTSLPLVPPINMVTTKTQGVAADYKEPFITYGYLVNQKINYGDFGGITAGFRSDWSSAFGGGSTPFTFPHADAHVLPSTFWKESSLENILPYLKVRAAYGEAGIQPGPFDRFPVINAGGLSTTNSIYTYQTTARNANLKVEVSKEFEAGTDFTLNATGGTWFSTINGSFTYWSRKSENVIYTTSTAISSGATGSLNNAIGMESNGIQFSLNTPVYNGGNFKWDFTTNWGHQVSKITSIAGGSDIILTTAAGSTSLVLTPGAIIGQVYGSKALTSFNDKDKNGNLYIQSGQESNYQIVEGKVTNIHNYQMQFKDYSQPLMNPNPKFNASFINSVGYKGFINLSFQFDWIYGSHLYNQTKEWMYRDGISGDFEKPVTINGNTGAFTAFRSSAYYNLWGSTRGAGNNLTKDYFVEDASFLRLRNISFAVDFARFTKIQGLHKLQLVLTGRNLLTVTKYTGYDPEVSSGAVNSAFDRGVDHSTLPNTKSYQIGLNVGF
ncbi:MAG: SusC/RagA family TonB-linked outer membrane protein [Bacteroidetes bacterium]|nr:SusC/RagA family TonB-linked outer membrane protein [Bacteroidota bacterium]